MALQVKYSINSVDFENNKVYVSQSYGFHDIPERKPVLSFEWPDENGTQYDLEEPPVYRERELTLECFVLGEGPDDMYDNFNTVMKEFDKADLQTLKVKPYSDTELVYEVFLKSVTPIFKEFRSDTMVGVFTIVMIEPSPEVFQIGNGGGDE